MKMSSSFFVRGGYSPSAPILVSGVVSIRFVASEVDLAVLESKAWATFSKCLN